MVSVSIGDIERLEGVETYMNKRWRSDVWADVLVCAHLSSIAAQTHYCCHQMAKTLLLPCLAYSAACVSK